MAPDLEWPVEVIRDRWGVPHILAETPHDLFFAQGFVTAQDRFWQLELNRRVAAGRLSELVGARALTTDRFLRRLGLSAVAAEEEAGLDPEERAVLQAYADGVNAYPRVHRGRLPPEFLLVALANPTFRPEPWTVRDSIAFSKYLSWILSANWDNELIRARLVAALGVAATAAIDPAGEALRAAGPLPIEDYRRIDPDLGFGGAPPPIGAPAGQSNNWAVAGSRTSSGSPLLASDPHLRPSQPGVWYEIHLRGGGIHVAGASIPAIPGVVIGHNERIAWGVTVATADTQDLVMQRIDPADPFRYESPRGWQPVGRRVESIRVAGRRAPVEEVVRLTGQGPILNPVAPGSDGLALALRSTVLRPAHLMRSLLALNRAGDWDAFRAALADWAGPPLNFVYADVAGNVGYQLAAWVPRRGAGSNGLLPARGWAAEDAWEGLIPFDDLPRALNPADGLVATANNRVVPAEFDSLISHEWTAPFRHDRIREVLGARRSITRSACRELQLDSVSPAARDLIGRLDGLDLGPGEASDALARLRSWDGDLKQRSGEAALYEVFRHRLILRWLATPVPPDLRDEFLGRGLHPVLNPTNSFHVQLGARLADRVKAARAGGWAPADAAALRDCLHEALAYLRDRLGSDPADWEWGRLHQVTFPHALGDKPLLGRLFNVGPAPIDGDSETVIQTGIDHWEPFAATGWCPSYRLIVDLGNFDRTLAVLPTGQSGHPLGRHYRDQHELYLDGRYHPCPFSGEAVERAAVARLALVPPA